MFLSLVGCVTLSDIIKRMEYYFGSIWTLYIFLFNWILISLFTFGIQYLCIKFSILPSIFGDCSCVGLYPMIFNLCIIEIVLSLPNQIFHFLGFIYMKQIYIPVIYCIFYNLCIRFDFGVIITVLYTFILIYCIPSIFHLSRYRIQKIERSKLNITYIVIYIMIITFLSLHSNCFINGDINRLLGCMVNDKLFIGIENIDYDCFVSTGKYITRKSDKNTELSLLNKNDNIKQSPDQSFHSTMMIQAQIAQMQRNASNSIDVGNIRNDEDNMDGSDREDLPFIHNLYSHGHESDISNISSHASHTGQGQQQQGVSPAVMRNTLHAIQHNNMPVSM